MTRALAHERGTVYVFVLATTSVVAVLGLTGLALVRARAAAVELAGQADRARLLARSGVELGSAIMSESGWRDAVAVDGVVARDVEFGDGLVTISARDPSDADLTDADHDPVELAVTAAVGRARQMYEVQFEPVLDPLPALGLALVSGDSIVFANSTVYSDGLIASNASISTTSSTIVANLQAVGTITGKGYRGSVTPGAAAIAMPLSDLFDEWQSIATPLGDVPNRIDSFVLGPGVNPFGTASPDGIYVLDCGGRTIQISDARILGTLIIRNANAASAIEGEFLGSPAQAGAPCLLVDGAFSLDLANTGLDESDLGVNLNPAGVPYLGVSDADTSDTYSSGITGLIYISGNATIDSVGFEGPVIVGGSTTVRGAPSFSTSTDSVENPPLGFGTSLGMRRVSGSWRRIVE